MSPSPELSPQSSTSPATEQTPLDDRSSTPPKSSSSDASGDVSVPADSVTPKPSSEGTSESGSLEPAPVLRKPPMRPVAKPQPPAAPAVPTVPKSPAIASVPSAPLGSKPVATVASTPAVEVTLTPEDTKLQAALRQQPIPPPSEPKQYRAIGMVRGRYTSSEEEFTRGELLTADGVVFNSVLLGRVMSLVKNHIELDKEHLWVVYPRTREVDGRELHIQIVGVWEPETLKKSESDSEDETGSEPSSAEAAVPLSSHLQDGYFSIRGEIVYLSQDDNLIVVKIQQAPRKSSQKAKAFKLSLKGTLDNPRTVGYFWDLSVQLQGADLVITTGTCIGLAPPKKRSKDDGDDRFRGRSRRPPMGRRDGEGAGRGGPPSRPTGTPRPTGNREAGAMPKPVKRPIEPTSEP